MSRKVNKIEAQTKRCFSKEKENVHLSCKSDLQRPKLASPFGDCYRQVSLHYATVRNIEFTFLKCFPVILTSGVVGNNRLWLITSVPLCISYRFDFTKNRSDVVFTGKKRLLGTLTPKKKYIHENPIKKGYGD